MGQEVRLEGVVVDDLAAEDEVDSDDELPAGDADGWTLLGTMDPRDTSDPQIRVWSLEGWGGGVCDGGDWPSIGADFFFY